MNNIKSTDSLEDDIYKNQIDDDYDILTDGYLNSGELLNSNNNRSNRFNDKSSLK